MKQTKHRLVVDITPQQPEGRVVYMTAAEFREHVDKRKAEALAKFRADAQRAGLVNHI